MFTATEDMISRVVRTVKYNTGKGESGTISATQIRVHFGANSAYPVKTVNQAIVTALNDDYQRVIEI